MIIAISVVLSVLEVLSLQWFEGEEVFPGIENLKLE